jgi:hypothetical protein
MSSGAAVLYGDDRQEGGIAVDVEQPGAYQCQCLAEGYNKIAYGRHLHAHIDIPDKF